MWPFAKRGTRVDEPVHVPVVDLPADLGEFAANTACIKLWLPDKLIQGLDILSVSHGQSRPDVLRWLLFEHVYGRPALEKLKTWKREQDATKSDRTDGIRMSPKGAPAGRKITALLLGKAQEDFKLWLPPPLKTELEKLARAEKLGLSDYLRKTLVRLLLGESFHHQWRAAIGKLPAEVLQFEQGPEI